MLGRANLIFLLRRHQSGKLALPRCGIGATARYKKKRDKKIKKIKKSLAHILSNIHPSRMLYKNILAVFLLVSSLFTGLAYDARAQEAKPAEPAPRSDFSELRDTDVSVVVDVIDPLTVRIKNGDTIHLTGLDYPDLDYYSPGSYSVLTVKILKDMLIGKQVKIYQSKAATARTNRMGHRIAHIERLEDGLWTQGTLIALGLARMRTTTSNDEMAGQMLLLEQYARKTKEGLWGLIAYDVHPASQAHRHIGSYQIIEGSIKSVSLKQNQIYLNFGSDWKQDFTISISATDRRAFRNAGYDFQNMTGAKVRVRGWVGSYNGPYIAVTHPAQLEVLSETGKKSSPQESSSGGGDKGNALPSVKERKSIPLNNPAGLNQ